MQSTNACCARFCRLVTKHIWKENVYPKPLVEDGLGDLHLDVEEAAWGEDKCQAAAARCRGTSSATRSHGGEERTRGAGTAAAESRRGGRE